MKSGRGHHFPMSAPAEAGILTNNRLPNWDFPDDPFTVADCPVARRAAVCRRSGEAQTGRAGRVRPDARRLRGQVAAVVRHGRLCPDGERRRLVCQLPLSLRRHRHRGRAFLHAHRVRAERARHHRQHLVRPQAGRDGQLLREHAVCPGAPGPEGRRRPEKDRGTEEGRERRNSLQV